MCLVLFRVLTNAPEAMMGLKSRQIMWVTVLCPLVTLVTVSSANTAQLTPILSLPGEHPTVLFMDVQSSGVDRDVQRHPDGDVKSEVKEVIPVLLGAVNTVEKIGAEANVSLGELACLTTLLTRAINVR